MIIYNQVVEENEARKIDLASVLLPKIPLITLAHRGQDYLAVRTDQGGILAFEGLAGLVGQPHGRTTKGLDLLSPNLASLQVAAFTESNGQHRVAHYKADLTTPGYVVPIRMSGALPPFLIEIADGKLEDFPTTPQTTARALGVTALGRENVSKKKLRELFEKHYKL